MSWDRPFDQPAPLSSGAAARTLRDAADYIAKLPQADRDRQEWRFAIQMLTEAAENRGPMLFAKLAIQRAIEGRAEPGGTFSRAKSSVSEGRYQRRVGRSVGEAHGTKPPDSLAPPSPFGDNGKDSAEPIDR